MKKNLLVIASLMLAITGCESSRSNDQRAKFYFTPNPEPLAEAVGAQSHSSDPNQANSSRNVGQSGTATNRSDILPNPSPE